MKIAVVGSGISGISAAWLLSKEHEITIFESSDRLGGHTNTIEINSLDNKESIGVDTGFIVCNPVTYPNFLQFMAILGVELIESNMSFSVSREFGLFEWCGSNLDSIFAQRSNLLNPSMYRMIWDCIRFHEHATRIAEESDEFCFDSNGNTINFDKSNIA